MTVDIHMNRGQKATGDQENYVEVRQDCIIICTEELLVRIRKSEKGARLGDSNI